MEQHIYSVSDLNNLVKDLLDSEPALSRVYVRGEISNYKLYPSGHHYFSLKDAEGAASSSGGGRRACAFSRRTA